MSKSVKTTKQKRMPYRPKVYKHKYDARVEYVDLDPQDLVVTKNGIYYPDENKAFSSVKVNVKEIGRPRVFFKLLPDTFHYDFEVDKIKELTISVNVAKGTSDLSLARILINNKVVKEFTEEIKEGGVYVYTHVFNTPQDTDFYVKVEAFDIENRMTEVEQKVDFVFKTYYGVMEGDDEVTPAEVQKLTPIIKGSRGHLFSGISSEYGKIVYAYPSDQGELVSIRDALHNMDYTDSFEKKTMKIGDGSYYVYSLKDAAAIDNIQILFS